MMLGCTKGLDCGCRQGLDGIRTASVAAMGRGRGGGGREGGDMGRGRVCMGVCQGREGGGANTEKIFFPMIVRKGQMFHSIPLFEVNELQLTVLNGMVAGTNEVGVVRGVVRQQEMT